MKYVSAHAIEMLDTVLNAHYGKDEVKPDDALFSDLEALRTLVRAQKRTEHTRLFSQRSPMRPAVIPPKNPDER